MLKTKLKVFSVVNILQQSCCWQRPSKCDEKSQKMAAPGFK